MIANKTAGLRGRLRPSPLFIFCLVLLAFVAATMTHPVARARASQLLDRARGHPAKTTGDRLAEFGAKADTRWHERATRAGINYPPATATLVVFKDSRELHLYAPAPNGVLRRLHTFPILAASGVAGPKLKEGDMQVPEGTYAIESLNPNSLYHVALRINYPNNDDLARAKTEGRTRLGGDIMIHGKNASVGCLAMGDEAAEDLFTLAAHTGISRLTVLLCPTDFRRHADYAPPPNSPAWVGLRYAELKAALSRLP